MVPSAPVPQLSWHHPPAATRDYLGYLLATGRTVVVPTLLDALARRGGDQQAARLTPDAWLSRLSQQAASPDLQQAATSAGSLQPAETAALTDWAQVVLDDAMPGWSEQLAARTRPLRDLWQARGPGFLRQLRRHLPPGADGTDHAAWPLLAVLPLSGGHGLLLPDRATILLEAMLTDADDRLPEILRLGWLVTQRALVDSAADDGPSGIPRSLHPLAACLLTLLLANDLEWMPVAPHLFGLALHQWSVVPSEEIPPLEERFRVWWNAADTRADWASVRRFLEAGPA